MENNISQLTKAFNTTTFKSVANNISNGLKKHFAKIAVAAVLVGIITYVLKTSVFVKTNKTPAKASSQPPKSKLDIEIDNIIKEKGCDPKYIVGIPKEDYKKFIHHVQSNEALGEYTTKMLYENFTVSKDDNIFFIGKTAVSAYCRALVSSEYIDHNLKKCHPTRLLFIDSSNPSFNYYKDVLGSPVLTSGDKYVIFNGYAKKHVNDEALRLYGDDGEWTFMDKEDFNNFKRDAPEELKFKLVEEIDDCFFIAMEKGAKEKVHWLKPKKASSTAEFVQFNK